MFSSLSEGCKNLYNKVLMCNDNYTTKPIKPQYLYSTDDTTQYVWEGNANSKTDKWYLVSDDANNSRYSNYKVESNKNMKGIRVKCTFTFSAIGGVAPFFVTVANLRSDELSKENCPTGFLPIKIPGLCRGGGGYDPTSEGYGYILFTRSDDNNDIKRLRTTFYRGSSASSH